MDAEAQSFSFIAQSASNSIYDLNSQLRKTQKLSSRNSSAPLAQAMAELGAQTSKTTALVNKAVEWRDSDLEPVSRKQKSELNNELESILHRVRQFQTSITERLRQQQHQKKLQEQSAGRGAYAGSSESTPLLGQQLQQQQQVLDQLDHTTVDLHSALIEERDTEIEDIQRGAYEINAIFRDLGILVSEQGQQIDTVEDNIANLATQTENASRQLHKAEGYQRSKGKWTCYFLLFLLAITIILGLSIL